jgi:hypothetical protein
LARISLSAAAAAFLVVAAATAAPASARGRAVTESASSGTVTARLSYLRSPRRFGPHFSRLSLTIDRGGSTLFAGRLTGLVPTGAALGRGKSVSVRDLDRDGEPEVVIDGWTNGAHCCELALIYRLTPDRAGYSRTVGDFGNAGYRLRDLDRDGRAEFVSGDDRFAYAFTAYAFSAFPIRIWRYAAGALVDVTRSYPRAIAADARFQLRDYRRTSGGPDADVRGVLAAYLADEYLLGTPGTGWRVVHVAERRGELRAGAAPGWPAGRGYLRKLRRFLASAGYAR